MEGFDVATTALLDNLSMCEFYAGIYNGVLLPSGSTENTSQLKEKLESALPQLYAAVIVFSVKAKTYFEAEGTHYPAKGTIPCKVFIKLPILNQNQGSRKLQVS